MIRRLVMSASVSTFGDGLTALALGLAAVSLTSDPMLVTGVFIFRQLPWVLALPISRRVDQSPHPGRALLGADALRFVAVAALAIAFLAGAASLAALYITALVLAVGEIVHRTATFVLVPAMVDGDDRARAFGQLESARSLFGTILGPAAGGAALGVSQALPFAGDAISFAVSGSIVSELRHLRMEHPDDGAPQMSARQLIAFARQHRLLRLLLVVAAALGLAQSMVISLAPLYATTRLGLDDKGFGLFLALTSLGAVAGGVMTPRLWRQGRHTARFLVGALLVDAAVYVAVAPLRSPAAAVGFFVLFALATSSLNVISATLRTTFAPPMARGRMGILYTQVIYGAQPLGALVAGVLARRAGIPTSFVTAGCVLGLVTLVAALPFRRAVAAVGA